ncbi:glycosyltransferase [Desulfovibrio inopinatus]|uniref:glycosyltransferase n=1 Tax=Desulfovibrio inopinatus TaxID=102109 RepID=UPI00040FFF7B|nr:glycosyltransferase [Desulfovibrio inopinatus]
MRYVETSFPGVAVVIPVYAGFKETQACLESVLSSRGALPFEIIVIDDASPESELREYVESLAAHNRIQLHVHAVNRGFVHSANRGLQLAGRKDVILLNADTRVHGDWVDRLADAAYAETRVGTVSPLSNNATILSYPLPCEENLLPDDADEVVLDTMCQSRLHRMLIEIPTGVGSCLYIRRDCLDDTGYLDPTTFGQGYGEECDFCIRSRRLGWSHTCAADVFVYHAGAVSFSSAREAKSKRGLALLKERYPEYLPMVHAFIKADPLATMRRVLDMERLVKRPTKRILLLSLNSSGGVERFIQERRTELQRKGVKAIVLRPPKADGESNDLDRWRGILDFPEEYVCPNLQYQLPDEYDQLVEDLKRLNVFHCEVHHFLGAHPDILSLPAKLGLPYDVMVHDYIWFCPRINLIDASGKYCQEPSISVCKQCIDKSGHCLDANLEIEALRTRSTTFLHAARKVLAPSQDAAKRMMHHFPGVQVVARPHPDLALPDHVSPPAEGSITKLRIAIIGAIGKHKGYDVLFDMVLDAQARNLPLEFVVIGYTCDDAALMRAGNVFVTGEYTEEEAVSYVRGQQCHVALFLSVWPETWCYALSVAFASGLYCFGFDLGAVAERIRATEFGELLPITTRPEELNDRLTALVLGKKWCVQQQNFEDYGQACAAFDPVSKKL